MQNILIAGLPLAAYGGMFLFVLVGIQVLGGLKVFKMKPICHKWLGVGILIVAGVHGIIAILYFLG